MKEDRRKSLIVLALCLAALVASVLFFQDGAGEASLESTNRHEIVEPADARRVAHEMPAEVFRPAEEDPSREQMDNAPKEAEQKGILVRVVDRAGEPLAGAGVGLMEISDMGFGDGPIGQFLNRVETDQEGRARVPVPSPLAIDPLLSHAVGLCGAFPDRPKIAIDPQELPSEELVLVAPDHGRLEFVVTWPAGELPEEGWRVGISTRAIPEGIPDVPVVEGRARFDFIALGLDFRIFARGPSPGRFKRISLGVQGPTAHLELKTVLLHPELDDPHPVLVGRLVDDTGRPLADREYGLSVVDDGKRGRSKAKQRVEHRSDGEGRIRTAVRHQVARDGDGLEVVVDVHEDGELSHRGRKILAAIPEQGELEIGDITCIELPLFLDCRVVNDSDEPVPDAHIRLNARSANGERIISFGITEPSAVFLRTDALGRFRHRATTELDRFELTVTATGYEMQSLSFAPGAADLVICLESVGYLKGRFLCDRNLDSRRVMIRAQRLSDDQVTTEMLDSRGRFHVPLVAGRYRLAFQWGDDQEGGVFADAGEVEIRAREVLDLGDLLIEPRGHFILLRARTDDRERHDSVQLRLLDPATREVLSRVTWFPLNMKRQIFSPILPVLLEIHHPGFEILSEVLSREAHDVWLDDGATMAFEVPGLEARSSKDDSLVVRVQVASETGGFSESAALDFPLDEAGRTSPALVRSGRIRVSLQAKQRRDHRALRFETVRGHGENSRDRGNGEGSPWYQDRDQCRGRRACLSPARGALVRSSDIERSARSRGRR